MEYLLENIVYRSGASSMIQAYLARDESPKTRRKRRVAGREMNEASSRRKRSKLQQPTLNLVVRVLVSEASRHQNRGRGNYIIYITWAFFQHGFGQTLVYLSSL